MDHLLTQMRGLEDEFGLASMNYQVTQVLDGDGKKKRTLYATQADDFKAAQSLFPLRLTAKDPFASNANSQQNFLSLLPRDLCAAVLTMITGLKSARAMAVYRSLRSSLSRFDVQRARNCSVYASQAFFVERYRQNLYDEKHKAMLHTQQSRTL